MAIKRSNKFIYLNRTRFHSWRSWWPNENSVQVVLCFVPINFTRISLSERPQNSPTGNKMRRIHIWIIQKQAISIAERTMETKIFDGAISADGKSSCECCVLECSSIEPIRFTIHLLFPTISNPTVSDIGRHRNGRKSINSCLGSWQSRGIIRKIDYFRIPILAYKYISDLYVYCLLISSAWE